MNTEQDIYLITFASDTTHVAIDKMIELIGQNYPTIKVLDYKNMWLCLSEDPMKVIYDKINEENKEQILLIRLTDYYGRFSSDVWKWVAEKRGVELSSFFKKK